MPQYLATTLSTAGAYLSLMNWNTKAPAGSASRALGAIATSVVFDPQGRFVVASRSGAGAVLVACSLPSLSDIPVPDQPLGIGYALAISPDGSTVAASHQSAPYFHLYETATWSKMPSPASMPPTVPQSMAFSPDGTLLAVAFNNAAAGHWRVYNTADWSVVAGLPAFPAYPAALAFSDDGSKILAAGSGIPGRIVDMVAKTISAPAFAAPLPAHGYTAVVIPGTGLGAFSINDSTLPIRVVDLSSGAEVKRLALPFPAGTSRDAIAVSPDGKYLLACTSVAAASVFWAAWRTSDWAAVDPLSLGIPGTGSTYVFSGPINAPSLTLRGEVRDIDGYVASRRVRVYERSTGRLCGEGVSSPVDGSYEIKVYEGDVPYDVQFLTADAENLNDLFYARAIAGTP